MVTITVPQGMPRPGQGPPSPRTPRKLSELGPGGALFEEDGKSSGTTSVKRSQGQESFPIAAKRQRSFGGENKREEEEDVALSPIGPTFPPDRPIKIETDMRPFSNSITNSSLLKNSIQIPGSPTILKSSLKPSTPTLIDAVRTNVGTDSPSESDKRGFYFDYVKKALSDKMRGRDKEYLELVAQFNLPSQSSSSAAPPLGLLQMLLHALTGVASKLDRRNHFGLVNAILSLPWATMGGDIFARVWIRFVCTLCSGRNEWLSEVLTRSIKGLSYRSDWRSLAYASGGSTSSQKPTRRIVYARIHTLLRSLLSLIPTLPSQLAPLIHKHFPHKSEGIREHVVFVQNMFELSEYAEELRQEIMELVIGRSVEIDVEIQIELDELEEAEADLDEADLDGMQDTKRLLEGELLDEALDAEDDSDEDDVDTSDDDAAGLDDLDSEGDDDFEDFANGVSQTERERIKQVRQLAEKLDALMSALFRNMEMMDRRYSDASKGIMGKVDLNPGRAIVLRNEQFGNLLRIFERTLLPTFKSRHVQFLLFWCASMERNYSEIFIGMLLNKAIYTSSGDEFDPQTGWRIKEGSPVVIRIAAASYVASLVARAKYIDAADAKIIMLNLCAFLDAHMDAHSQGALATQSPTGIEMDALSGPHAMFYAVAQACFYIFCFRWRDLHSTDGPEQGEDEVTDEDDDEESGNSNQATIEGSGRVQWCKGIDSIKRAILSQFNPLAHCSTTVVRQFASVAQLTGFMYCWNVIERNSRSNARRREGSATTPTLSRTNSVSSFHSPAPQRADSSTTVTSSVTSLQTPGDQSPSTPTKQYANPILATKSEIDSFFPFDPYRLRGSTRWIEPIYREWSDVAPEGMLDESDDDDENESQSADDDAESVSSDSSAEEIRRKPVTIARTGLNIPGGMRHRPLKPSKLSNAHASQSFGASISTDESSSMAQSLDAMSISPRYV